MNTSPDEQYDPASRPFQGIPGIERHRDGRLFATWYASREADVAGGGGGEGPTNYVMLGQSDDDGVTWRDPIAVIDPPGTVRAFDPCLWIDPQERLWWFWAQSYLHWDGRGGVWTVRCDAPGADRLVWTDPRRLCNGIMMNKPTVLRDGTWLLPAAVWKRDSFRPDMADQHPDMAAERFSNVVASTDQGKTWQLRGSADVPERTADEHMVVELDDGRLWMLVRTRYGIGQSFSSDAGATWSPGEDSGLPGPDSRFHIRRLRSGRLLLINHNVDPQQSKTRNNLTAWLSDDDASSWRGGLLLDAREAVSYPDAAEADDGSIYVIYDWNRITEKRILMAVFKEEDISAGQCVSDTARMRCVVSVP